MEYSQSSSAPSTSYSGLCKACSAEAADVVLVKVRSGTHLETRTCHAMCAIEYPSTKEANPLGVRQECWMCMLRMGIIQIGLYLRYEGCCIIVILKSCLGGVRGDAGVSSVEHHQANTTLSVAREILRGAWVQPIVSGASKRRKPESRLFSPRSRVHCQRLRLDAENSTESQQE